ncbi:hypothetical protein C8R48DRAFT_738004 [Suillus tomentosus]|nr:hypothetical protein C8R48DRAFT_738004 [Suillus tomentosus]
MFSPKLLLCLFCLRVISHEDPFSLRIRYKESFGMKTKDIAFDPDVIFLVSSASEGQEYIKSHEEIMIVVALSGNTSAESEQSISTGQSHTLLATTSEIFRSCPQFRILVIGKCFDKHSYSCCEASIDDEFVSSQNDRFVLHDSKGFEPGEQDNLKIVRDFIGRRSAMPDLKDQLHVVLLCFEIPRAGGRLLETGTEEFLESKRDGTLGNVPVIVVLTKYDMLIERMERNLDEASLDELSDEEIEELVKNKAEAELRDTCIGPLEELAGSDIPHATISTAKGYKETLTNLIQITESCVNEHLVPEAAVMTSIAQRMHPGLKTEALIKVKYWKALASCPKFKNYQIQDCLRVLHTDIVDVWNFRDPHHHLHSQEFRELMMNMVDKIQAGSTVDPTKTLTFGLSMVGTIAGIVSALAAPAAPIVLPIAVGAVLVVWVHEVYKMSHVVLQRFMAYIMHLTLVLQTLFIVSESRELTRRAIKLAVNSYLASPISGEVLNKIQDYDKQLTILERADSDTLDKIEEMMQFYKIDAAQISNLQANTSHVDLSSDEPW